MNAALGAGWRITHLTDRVIKLEKDSTVYRRFTDRDGYVLLRAEPGMDRPTLIQKAFAMAIKQDETLAQRIAHQLMPTGRSLMEYRAEQSSLAPRFAVSDQEPSQKVYRP